AQAIMQKLGYSDAKPLPIKVQTRNLPTYRDPAVILIDQLKKIYIAGELDILDTPRWYARLAKKDYTIGLNVTGVSVDDPDGNIVENYSCNSERNYTQYCNAEVDKLLAAQSRELDRDKRTSIVWEIERLLAEDAARPSVLWFAVGNCWQPYVKNFHPHDNSQYNNLRFEDVWLDKLTQSLMVDERAGRLAPHQFPIRFTNSRRHASTFPRRELQPELLSEPPSIERGRRESRVLAAPIASHANKKAHERSRHRFAETIRPSLRNGLRLIPRSPWRPGFLATIACGSLRQLDASVGASGPHGFAVRYGIVRLATPKRPPHPAPNVRDDREAPLSESARRRRENR